jgi:hypothetical protein
MRVGGTDRREPGGRTDAGRGGPWGRANAGRGDGPMRVGGTHLTDIRADRNHETEPCRFMAAHSGVCGGGGVEGGVLVYLAGVGRPRQARVAAGVVATTDAWQPGSLSRRGRRQRIRRKVECFSSSCP